MNSTDANARQFNEWFPTHDLKGNGIQLYSKSDLEAVWQASRKATLEECAEIAENHITTVSVYATSKEAKAATAIKLSIAAMIRHRLLPNG